MSTQPVTDASHRPQVTAVTADCASEEAIAAVCEAAVAEHGRLDFFLANAGILGWRTLQSIKPDEFLNLARVNTLR